MNTFENTQQIAEFFYQNKAILTEKYKERNTSNLGGFRARSVAYFIGKEILQEQGILVTDCQIYRLAKMLVMKVECDKDEKNS
jgi:hypothetical protein